MNSVEADQDDDDNILIDNVEIDNLVYKWIPASQKKNKKSKSQISISGYNIPYCIFKGKSPSQILIPN